METDSSFVIGLIWLNQVITFLNLPAKKLQAFKAANPNCRLEDFIRWYSPRDWITVPITRPIIPEDSTVQDLVEDADRSEDVELPQEDYANPDETFTDLDTAGNEGESSIRADKSSDKLGQSVEQSEKMETSEQEVSPSDIDVEVKSDKSEEKMEDEEGREPALDDNVMDSEQVGDTLDEPIRTTSIGEDSDDEFVDAEEDPVETSDHAFLSASEASDRHLSASPETVEEPEPAVPETSEIDDKEENDDKVTEEQAGDPRQNVRHEEPLDPEVYGGHLSARMSKESVWKEVWHVAKPIPIWQQKRLFDDTKEAERILHFFIQSEMKTVASLIMPSLLHAAYNRILDCTDSKVPFVQERIDSLYQKLKDLDRYTNEDTDVFQDIITEIRDCELIASKYHSIKNKLSHQSTSTQQEESTRKMTELERRTRRNIKGPRLSSQPAAPAPEQTINEEILFEQLVTSEAEIVGAARSPLGSVLQRLFHAQQAAAASRTSPSPAHPRQIPIFPLPIGREYILQTVTKHPSPASRDCLQRTFVAISGSEFRMAYANSSDKTFL